MRRRSVTNPINRTLSLEIADEDLTLSSDQANRNGLIIVTGTLTAERIVTFPANHRRLTIRNATTGDQQLRVTYLGNGMDVIIAADQTVMVQGDGKDLYAIGDGSDV